MSAKGSFYFDLGGVRYYAYFEPHTQSTWAVRLEAGRARWHLLYHPDTRETELPYFSGALPPLDEIRVVLRGRPELKGFPDES